MSQGAKCLRNCSLSIPSCYSRLHQKKITLVHFCRALYQVYIRFRCSNPHLIHAAPFRANLNSGLKSDIIPRSSLPSTKAYQQHLQPEVGEGQRLGVPPPLVRLERRTITVTRIKATMTPGIPPEPCHEVPLKDGERLKERLKAYFETVWKFQKDSVDIKFDTNIDYVLGDVEADFAFGYRWSNRSGSTTGFVASSRHPFLAPSQSPPLDGSFIEVFSGTSSVNEDGYVTHA